MNNVEEKVVAVVEPTMASGESELACQVSNIEATANSLVVSNDQQYAEAGELGKMLKQKMADVTDFFAPMKKAAHDAHKQICDREKQMLTPLKNAEGVLKRIMGDYSYKKEQERRAAEEEARRLAQEEAERKLAESIAAEKNGDQEAARAAMLDAEMADNASRSVSIAPEPPKADGVSTRKDWEIVSIDDSKVPVSVAGVVVRPVDESAIMRLIRGTKGKVKIDGVVFREKAVISFRR